MDHRICCRCSTAKTLDVRQIATVCLHSRSGQCLDACIAARQAQHLMSCAHEFRHHSRTDKTCRSCYKNTHMSLLLLLFVESLCLSPHTIYEETVSG